MTGGIDRSASKGDTEDDVDSWEEHDFAVGGKEGAEWETTKWMRTMKKITIIRRRSRKRWG